MRLKKLTILISLALLATAAYAAPALASSPSVSDLKQRVRDAKQLRQRARHRLTVAAANLAGARQLHSATSAVSAATVSTTDPAAAQTTTTPAAPSTTPVPAATPTTAARSVAVPLGMDPRLAADLLADGAVTADEVATLQNKAAAAKRTARRWQAKVQQLQRKLRRLQRIAEWNRNGRWKPLIEIAAAKYGVSARGLYRMMMFESTGRRTAGTTFKGLFQYYPSTWRGSWNPWRHQSIYDGWAQIRATAYAISRGMGPSQWPHTYPMAF